MLPVVKRSSLPWGVHIFLSLSPSFPLRPQPSLALQPCRRSFWASLPSQNWCDCSWIPPFLQNPRTLYFCSGVQCIVWSLTSCAPAVLLPIITQWMSPSLSRRIKSLSKCLFNAQSMHKMPEVFQHAVYVLLQCCLSENPSYDLASVCWVVSVWIISVPCWERKSETNTKYTHTLLSKYMQKTKRGKI